MWAGSSGGESLAWVVDVRRNGFGGLWLERHRGRDSAGRQEANQGWPDICAVICCHTQHRGDWLILATLSTLAFGYAI